MESVRNVDHLRSLIKSGVTKFQIYPTCSYEDGYTKMDITLTGNGRFKIQNKPNGSSQTLTEDDLFDTNKTLVGRALLMGAFWTR